jgi:phage portal protein BeeE
MQRSSAAFFKNMAQPSGILTAPGSISDPTAARLKKDWNEKFSGHNVGRVAVLGDGLKFEPVTVTAAAAQQVEQLRLTAEMVCTAFGVPTFMVGVGSAPIQSNIEALTQQYWSQTLQTHIEGIECGATEGLGLDGANTTLEMAVKLDLDALLRMDTATRMTTWKTAVSGGFMAPNEARQKENMPPVPGGQYPYLQQQNYSLEALAKRDAAAPSGPPSAGALPAPAKPAGTADDDTNDDDDADSSDESDSGYGKQMLEASLLRYAATKLLSQEGEAR